MSAPGLVSRDAVVEVLRTIAPEVEAAALDNLLALRHQVDLDSMDWLNFLIGLQQRFGVEVPESDYARLVSLDDLLNYLHDRASQH
ncbi:MAG: acyl carrier protein [Betaproteobacteria bacterium]|nr:acyl carrier protein [Betaproteobacteria bacterium]